MERTLRGARPSVKKRRLADPDPVRLLLSKAGDVEASPGAVLSIRLVGYELWFLGDKRGIAYLAQEGFRLGVVDPAAPTAPECRKAIGLGPAPAWASHGSGGLVMHSARVVLVDRAGVIRAYHPTTDAESMGRLHANLRQLLAAESR